MNKKILFCLACDISMTGTPLVVKDIISCLGGGYDVTVFTPCSVKYDIYEENVKIIALNMSLSKMESYWKLRKSLDSIFRDERYDIVHINSANMHLACVVSFYFHRKGSYVITHSHNVISLEGSAKKLLNSYERNIVLRSSNKLLACSKDAGYSMFGVGNNSNFEVLNNYVDCEKYYFSETLRNDLRINFGNKYLLGCVGAFNDQKNQIFLVELMKILGDEYGLILVGDGEKRQKCLDYCKENRINNVYFVGNVEKPQMYYSAFDIFVLSSLHEGCPRVIFEAMVSNLNIIVSDCVPFNPAFDCTYLPLNQQIWVDTIRETIKTLNPRKNCIDKIIEYGYDQDSVIKKIMEIYQDTEF